jgi:hypothetical protein
MYYRDIISSGNSIADCSADGQQRSVCRCLVRLELELTTFNSIYTSANNGFLLIIFKQGAENISFSSQTQHFEQTHYSFQVDVMS